MLFRNKIKISGLLALFAATLIYTAQANATNQGDWLLKFGAVNVSPSVSSGLVAGIPGSGVDVDDDTQLYGTVSYMLKENIALELLVATPFTHDIRASGSIAALGKIAETKHLPPTFSVQYHFSPKESFRPYVGAGLNYTTFFSEKATNVITSISLDDSFGLAVQAGFDMDINEKWFFNADIRYINIETTAKTDIGNVDVEINPTVISLGVGTRF